MTRGREVAFLAEASAAPITLHFHGIGSSAEEARAFFGGSRRVLGIDRPGIGWTSPGAPGVEVAALDAIAVLDSLGVERVTVSAFSGGAPFALATVAKLGARTERLILFNPGLDPGDASKRAMPLVQRLLFAGAYAPPIYLALLRSAARDPNASIKAQRQPEDRAALERLGQSWPDLLTQALQQGDGGVRNDLATATSPWAQSWPDVTCETLIVATANDPYLAVNRAVGNAHPNIELSEPTRGGHLAALGAPAALTAERWVAMKGSEQ